MKTRSRRQGKRREIIEEPAHDDVDPTPQTRQQQQESSSSRKNGQQSSSSTTTSTTTTTSSSSSGMKGKSSTATSGKKRPRTDQPSPATFMPEALPNGFHPALTTSTMPPWSSGQQHPHHEHRAPGSSHPFSNSTSLHNHELVGILEHILATGSVARAASVRHQGLVSYLHHANKHVRTSTTAAIAGPLAIQSQEHYDEKHRRRRNGGHDTASHDGDDSDGDGETSDGKSSASVDVTNDVDDLDSNPQMEIETTDRIIDVNGIKLVVGNDFILGEEEDDDSSSTARTIVDDEAAAAAKVVPTGNAYYSSIGVWPSIDLEESKAEKEGTNHSSSKSAAASAAAATDQFRASLASDDSWELEHEDGLGSSEITLSGGSAGSVAVDNDRAVLASLLDRCWQRAVHTMSSVVPYDPYGALYGPSSASTTTVAEDVEQDEDALAESSSSLVVVRDDDETAEKEKEEEKEEEERSMIQSILEREATFVIDSVLHLALTDGKKIAEQRVERSETTENDKETPDNIDDALTWIDIARVLSSAAAPATGPVNDGGIPEYNGQSTEPVSSHIDILRSFTRTVEVQAGMAPIALNEESLRSILSRLLELFDPSLTTLESESPSGDG